MHSLFSAINNKLSHIIDKIDKAISPAHVYLNSLLDVNYNGLHLYWVDRESRVLLMNAAQATVFETLPQHGLGKTIPEIGKLLHIEDAARKLCANNRQVLSEKKVIVFEEEFDGRIYLSYKAPFYGMNGEVQGVLGVSTDITQQKHLQDLLYASKQATDIYLESILMSSHNNIYWVDTESRVIGCNDQQAKVMGLSSRMDLIGKSIFDVGKMLGWAPEVAQRIRHNDLEVIRTRQTMVTEEEGIFAGEERFYLSFKSPMLNNRNEVIGVLGISTDITAQKRIERDLEKAKQKAEAANAAKTGFIANISHDIRTPLTGMQGIAAILAERLPAEFQPEIHELIKAGDELLALLNNVLILTKYEFSEIPDSTMESFDLYRLLNKLLELFTPFAKQKNLSLRINYPDDILRRFTSIPILLQRIILNLMGNALKFTEQGGVTISIAQDHSAPAVGDLFPVIITVADTGIGIPEEHCEKIFESFYRLKPTYQEQHSGSGLGLAIVRQFAAKLGGKVWVKSEVGKGSNFFIQLPLLISDAAATSYDHETSIDSYAKSQVATLQVAAPLGIKQSYTESAQTLRILLVEDHRLIQKIVTNLLNQLNSQVDLAGTAAQALQLAQQNAYDLIFMDIGLPDNDGLWAARRIRQLSRHARTPIVALTAHSDAQAHDVFEQAGINETIIKPLTFEEARACFQRHGLG